MNQTGNDVTEQRFSHHQRMWRKVGVCISGHVCLCVWRAVPGQELTSADGAVSYVAWLTGTQVSSDGVGADGVLITQILATGALVMLWGRDRERATPKSESCTCICCVKDGEGFEKKKNKKWLFFFQLSRRNICGNSTDERTVNKQAGRECEAAAELFFCQQLAF